jgi:hypothetical protein
MKNDGGVTEYNFTWFALPKHPGGRESDARLCPLVPV